LVEYDQNVTNYSIMMTNKWLGDGKTENIYFLILWLLNLILFKKTEIKVGGILGQRVYIFYNIKMF